MATEKIVYEISVTGNASKEFENANKKYNDFKKNIEQPVKEIPLTRQMRDMKAEMLKMVEGGNTGGKAFDEMQQRAGGLKDSMDEVRGRIKYFSSDTRQLDAAVAGFQAVGGAAQAVVGTMSLFGISTNDAMKYVQALVSIESVLNGVKIVQNALQKESILMIGLSTAKTKAATAVQGFYTTAIGASTGAMKALKIAMMGTGILALVAGLGTLIYALSNTSSAAKDAKEELDKFDKMNQTIADNDKKNALNTNKYLDEKTKAQINYYNSIGENAKAAKLEIAGLETAKGKLNDNWVLQKIQEQQKSLGRTLTTDESISLTRDLKEQARIQRETIGYQIKTIQSNNNKKSTLQNKDTNKLINAAPKTFNVYINELGSIDQVNIMSDEDEKAFQQKLTNVLTSALQTIQVQNA